MCVSVIPVIQPCDMTVREYLVEVGSLLPILIYRMNPRDQTQGTNLGTLLLYLLGHLVDLLCESLMKGEPIISMWLEKYPT